jgi:hypothetical protein
MQEFSVPVAYAVRPDGNITDDVFAGFAIGWLSATIARFVYPPRRNTSGA